MSIKALKKSLFGLQVFGLITAKRNQVYDDTPSSVSQEMYTYDFCLFTIVIISTCFLM